ncbi:nucleotidyltransferase family protein [Fuscibacter oryzae]|uniref:Nucleotidyltransferase family protein n=1 Tax=Fuscibacter oryzae TaxID=2803939 RepID=A0A8J7STY4_9RHOB|nr:nucleotidyltransferase family protein [Fuscibacter oryzae]MBL4929045.1 nucleotidyltransferase family protein [Fuscibacter oryzae]
MRPFPLMLFAAGKGTRMGALTANCPKPLIKVASKPLIDHALNLAAAARARPIVVNTHYLGDQIVAHLSHLPIAVSAEDDLLLETGGGLRKALPLLQSSPVMTLNSDAVWTGQNPLLQLSQHWDDSRMDALLLLAAPGNARGHTGQGDFLMDDQGRLVRAKGAPGLVYLGAQILRTDRLAEISEQIFSLNLLWDRLIASGRVFGLVHQGGWCDVGRPEGIAEAEALLAGARA